jgi:DNA repair protein RecN (Recombination protein N)
MLKSLSIKNYILISELELKFSDGFTVITGETGAGKSILIGALSLILGKRADTDVLLHQEQKCVIEGTFHVEGYELEGFYDEHDLDHENITVLRREIGSNGKSRAFVNDTPVNLQVLKALGDRLVDIHSQHETLMLNESGFQLAILDHYARNTEALSGYGSAYLHYHDLKDKLQKFLARASEIRAEEDYLKFQYEELHAAGLKENELDELEEEVRMLSNAEEIKGKLYEATQLLNISENSILDRLREVSSNTGRVASYHKEIAEYHERLESLIIEMKDISTGLERLEEGITFDAQRLEELGVRLDMLNGLLQKHRARDIKALLEIYHDIKLKIRNIETLDEDIDKLEHDTELAHKGLQEAGKQLSERRKAGIASIEEEITATLRQLGMADAVMQISLEATDRFFTHGMDKVEFMFSANLGSPPAPVSRIASGGELSRLMLAMKSMITRKSLLPTIILDEIDMGVSGDIAGKVGKLLSDMARNMQLIAITHLPQIAGKADEHFRVFKKSGGNRTVTGVERLSEEERIEEIATMLSDQEVSLAAKETARELLGKEHRRKNGK